MSAFDEVEARIKAKLHALGWRSGTRTVTEYRDPATGEWMGFSEAAQRLDRHPVTGEETEYVAKDTFEERHPVTGEPIGPNEASKSPAAPRRDRLAPWH